MASTFTAIHVHMVFSTKNRERWIAPAIEGRLWAYLGGIASENGLKPIEIGGVEDHIHALLGIAPTLAVSRVAQLLKGGSSQWIHATFPDLRGFAWQDGYGAFSVSQSALAEVTAYVRSQREHHRTRTFDEEYRLFLKKHGIHFDEKYLLG